MSEKLTWDVRAVAEATPIGCGTWAPDPEAGPKWCDNCGRRRNRHLQVPNEFDPNDKSTW